MCFAPPMYIVHAHGATLRPSNRSSIQTKFAGPNVVKLQCQIVQSATQEKNCQNKECRQQKI